MSRVLRLTLLAPEIVEVILDRQQPADLRLEATLTVPAKVLMHFVGCDGP